MNKRIDIQTALYIEAAMNISRSRGVAPAARSLAEQDIPIDIALRVLTRPEQRRVSPLQLYKRSV